MPLKRFCRDLYLKLEGFEWKSNMGWERFEWGKGGNSRVFLKISHISPIKLKTRVFRGSDSLEITHEKYHWSTKNFREKLLVAKQSRDSCVSLYMKFVFSSFCLNLFSREVLSCELLAKRPLNKFLKNKNLKHESIKSLSETYKILKNIFGFDRQAIEHTHHIWSCTITQMK